MTNQNASNTLYRFGGFLMLFCVAGCVTWQAADITSSDPGLAAQQRAEAKTDSDNVQAFIVDHPELDAETKKELRSGDITVHEALERLKQRSQQK